MRTKDFIREIANRSELTIADSGKFYEALCDILEDRIVAGEDVAFRGLFTIIVKDTPARTVKCGFDGKVHDIPARKTVTYKTSPTLKKKLIAE